MLVGIALVAIILLEGLIMAVIDDLNAAVAQLKTDVEAYIAAHQGAVPVAQVQAVTTAVQALDAEVKAAQ
jgi:outer membrane murein-binding lipoprotein Lpp